MDWLNRYQRFWSENLDRLAAFVEEDQCTSNQALPISPRASLTIKRRLNASPEKVYAAWTDPKKIIRWFGPANIRPETMRAEIDARAGGRYPDQLR